MPTNSAIPANSTPVSGAANEAANFSLRHYWHVIIERRWLALTALALILLLDAIYLFRAQRIYLATARIQINRESENVLNLKDVFSMEGRELDYLTTQYKNLQSRTLMESVIKTLKLDTDPRYSASLDIPLALSKDVTIAPVRLSRLVDVRVEHPDPEKAAQIANTIVKTFIDDNLNQKLKSSFDAVTWLRTQASDTKGTVKEADSALHSYLTNYNEVSLEEGENIVRQGLMQAKADFSRAASMAIQAERLISEIDTILNSGKPLESIPQIAESVTVQRLRQEVAVREASLASLLKRYRDKHPTVIQARSELANLKENMQRESETVLETLRNSAQIARKQEEVLSKLVNAEEKKQLALNQLRIQYSMLKREADNNKTIYSSVLVRLKETELMSRLASNNMRVVDDASKPINPVKPRVIITIGLGIIGGVMVAIALAFFVSYLDDSVKSQDDIETYLRIPFLGYVPNIKTNSVVERDLQAHLHQQSNASEGFRTIQATLSLMPKADKYRVLAISSTIPSEGKSLVASNLAIVFAQTGLKTLLVDADLRRPSVHKAFQLHSPIGLSSYLSKEVDQIDGLVHTTEVPNLDAICCGAVPTSPSELIGSPRMAQFLDEVRKKYDRVVLDCPPISAVSDPLVIGAKADGLVFVTKFNKIRREHARKSVQRVQNSGIYILGTVINDIDFEGRDSYYYSYYYYQNRYYASYKTDGKEGEGKKPAAKTPKA